MAMKKHAQFLAVVVLVAVASCVSAKSWPLSEEWGYQDDVNVVEEDVVVPSIKADSTTKDYPYTVNGRRDVPCILANMLMTIIAHYKVEGKTKDGTLTVSPKAKVTGTCSDIISKMTLTWQEGEKKDEENGDGDKENGGGDKENGGGDKENGGGEKENGGGDKENGGGDKQNGGGEKENGGGDTRAKPREAENKDNVINFIFINDHTNFSLFSIDADIYMDEKNFPDYKGEKRSRIRSDVDLRLFVAPVQDGLHKCANEIKLTIGDFELKMSEVALIAFNTDKDVSQRKAMKCPDKPDGGKTFPYVLKNDKNEICSMARMSISLNVSYTTKDSKTEKGIINVPNTANVTGSCMSPMNEMKLLWTASTEQQSIYASDTKENTVHFSFLRQEKSASVYRIGFNIFPDDTHFPNAVDKRLFGQTSIDFNGVFSSPANGLYSCANQTTVQLYPDSTMNITDVLLIPFDADKDIMEKEETDCSWESGLTEKNFQYASKSNDADVPCILANMTISMKISYMKTDGTSAIATLPVPSEAKSTGTCQARKSSLDLSWPSPVTNKTNKITFDVGRNGSYFFVHTIDVDVYLDKERFKDAADETFGSTKFNLNLFAANADDGLYRCDQPQNIAMDNMEMSITDVVFVAFNTKKIITRKEVETCSAKPDDTTTSSTSPTTTESSTSPTTTESTTVSIPPPEPDPSVKKFNYFVVDEKTEVACILANMSISLQIPYETKDSKSEKAKLNVPIAAKVSGSCDDASSTMELRWTESTEANFDTGDTGNVVTLTFRKDDSRFSLHSVHVSAYMDKKNFHDPKPEKLRYEATANVTDAISSSVDKLYRCTRDTSIKVDAADVTISDLILIAFNTEKVVAARSEENCDTGEPDDNTGAIVGGIIGGIALLGIIVFAIITYRKRRFM